MSNYDAIIIGAGHNGLACAAYLARAGRRVLLLERAGQPGGLAATREFHPGFRASVAHTVPQLTRRLVQDLDLERHGFRLAAQSLETLALDGQGRHIAIGAGGLRGASAADSDAWPAYRARLETFAAAINPFWHQRPPLVGSGELADFGTLGRFAWRLRTLGKADMREFMRMIFLPARDLVDEHFEDPLLKAALSWDALLGSKLAPRSPNNAVLALLLRMSGDVAGALPLPAGGAGGLVDALLAAATGAGAELRTDCAVARVSVTDGRATGVELADGERLEARAVLSSADPKTSFLDLLGARHLGVQFTHRINRLRTDGLVAKLHLALDGLPVFTGLDQPTGRLVLAPSMQYLEDAFDCAKYGELTADLPMEVIVPSLYDDSLAPAGQHVLSATVQYVPYRLRGGWPGRREELLDALLARLEQHAPGIRDQVSASELLTPQDLETQFGARGGHWHHAEFAIDTWWMNRPTYGASQYRSPVPGFYLCGAGAHPGGGLMGAAGANAARALLEEN